MKITTIDEIKQAVPVNTNYSAFYTGTRMFGIYMYYKFISGYLERKHKGYSISFDTMVNLIHNEPLRVTLNIEVNTKQMASIIATDAYKLAELPVITSLKQSIARIRPEYRRVVVNLRDTNILPNGGLLLSIKEDDELIEVLLTEEAYKSLTSLDGGL